MILEKSEIQMKNYLSIHLELYIKERKTKTNYKFTQMYKSNLIFFDNKYFNYNSF